jgi:monothiol glutaredoxin
MTPELKSKIEGLIASGPIVLFMKGTANFPMCGFSARAVQALKLAGAETLVDVNVLEDQAVREGIKEFSSWPTIPQAYIKGEFIGGSDILLEMLQSGELQKLVAGAKTAAA